MTSPVFLWRPQIAMPFSCERTLKPASRVLLTSTGPLITRAESGPTMFRFVAWAVPPWQNGTRWEASPPAAGSRRFAARRWEGFAPSASYSANMGIMGLQVVTAAQVCREFARLRRGILQLALVIGNIVSHRISDIDRLGGAGFRIRRSC